MTFNVSAGVFTCDAPQALPVGASPTFAGLTLSGLTASTALYADVNKKIASLALTNGQLMVGSTGAIPVATTLTGTSNQITVANAAGSITLATPQNIHTAATPTFSLLNLSATSAQLALGTTTVTTITATAPTASFTATLPAVNVNCSFLMDHGAATVTGSFTFSNASNFFTGVTSTAPVYLDASGTVKTLPLTNGQLMIGSTGAIPVAATLTGTSNQITVASAAGSITLATPQNIHTAATPTFAGATLSGIAANSLVCTSAANVLEATTLASSTGMTFGLATGTLTIDTPQSIQTSASPTFVAATLSGLTASTAVYSNTSKQLTSLALTNGQLMIGSTSANPVAASLTGTTNQITVTNAAGSITLATPQNIHTAATPTFAGATLSGIAANSLVCTSAANVLEATTLATSTGMTFGLATGTLTVNTPQSIQTSASPTFVAATLSGLTASTALYSNASKQLTSLALTNGQLMIGSTGANPVAATITGTSNQVSVTNTAGAITLATPQNIHTGATPTFSTLALAATSSQLVLGFGNTTTISGIAPFASHTVTIPDPGAAASFLMTNTYYGYQNVNAVTNFLSGATSNCSLYEFSGYQSGTTITGVSSNFLSAMNSGVLLWQGGYCVIINGFTSSTVLTSAVSQTVGSSGSPLSGCIVYSPGTGAAAITPTGQLYLRPAMTTGTPTSAIYIDGAGAGAGTQVNIEGSTYTVGGGPPEFRLSWQDDGNSSANLLVMQKTPGAHTNTLQTNLTINSSGSVQTINNTLDDGSGNLSIGNGGSFTCSNIIASSGFTWALGGTPNVVEKWAQGTLTNTQILGLATPVTLIGAPGAGKMYVITENGWNYTYGTAAYAGGSPIELGLAGTSSLLDFGFGLTAGSMTNAYSTISWGPAIPMNYIRLSTYGNSSVYVQNSGSAFTGGSAGNSLTYWIRYYIISAA